MDQILPLSGLAIGLGLLLAAFVVVSRRSTTRVAAAADRNFARLGSVLNLVGELGTQVQRVHESVERESAGRQSDSRSLTAICNMLARWPTAMTDPVDVAASAGSDTWELTPKAIIGELAHVLATPMSSLSLSLTNLERQLVMAGGVDGVPARLQGMRAAVDLCESSLLTFRGLVNVTPLGLDSAITLPDAIRAAFDTTNIVCGRGVVLSLKGITESVPGFSVRYLQTLLQPLIENAVEASPSGAVVSVELAETGDAIILLVHNHTEEPVDMRYLSLQGLSTKPAGTGLGTKIAARLAGIRRGHVTFTVDALTVRATVRLPRRS